MGGLSHVYDWAEEIFFGGFRIYLFPPPFKQQKSGRDEDSVARSLFAEFEGVEGAEIRESNPPMNLWYSKFNSNVRDLMACC